MKNGKLDQMYAEIATKRGGVAQIHSAFSDFLEGMKAHFEFYESVIIANELPLCREEVEYLAVITSEANACPYCVSHHRVASDKHSTMIFSAGRKKLLKRLAEILTKEPHRARNLQQEFVGGGFSKRQWQHAVMVVSYFNFANRCAHAMGLELEEAFEDTCL